MSLLCLVPEGKDHQKEKGAETRGMEEETQNLRWVVPEENWREENTVQHHGDTN